MVECLWRKAWRGEGEEREKRGRREGEVEIKRGDQARALYRTRAR